MTDNLTSNKHKRLSARSSPEPAAKHRRIADGSYISQQQSVSDTNQRPLLHEDEGCDQNDEENDEQELNQSDGRDDEQELNQSGGEDDEQELNQSDGRDDEQELNQSDGDDDEQELNQSGGEDDEELLDQSGGEDDEELLDQSDEDDMFHYADEDDEDDEDDGKREVEHHTHIIGSQSFDIEACTYEGIEGLYGDWLDTIVVVCTLDGKEIGRGVASYIDRSQIASEFWDKMEQSSQELCDLAFSIFDRYGRLRGDFKEHPVRKGSGIWGFELSYGPLFFIEELHVDKDWRRKGIGKVIVQYLTRKGHSGGRHNHLNMSDTITELGPDENNIPSYAQRDPRFDLVIPGWLTRDVEESCEGKSKSEKQRIRRDAMHTAVAFYRSLGYRRIGNSFCFGLALDETHRSHMLLASQDFDPVEEPIATEDDEDDEEEIILMRTGYGNTKRLERMQRLLPLHHAIVTLADLECLAFLKASGISPTDSRWSKTTEKLNNLLHTAATESKPESVRWLLENIDAIHHLSSARNLDGYTPFEAARDFLETKRTRVEDGGKIVPVYDKFTGFAEEEVRILLALGATTSNQLALADKEFKCLKYGCTCGECIEGILSPRMCFALKLRSGMSHDTLNVEIDDGPEWVSWYDFLMEPVPQDIQQNFRTNKSLRQGYSNVFQHIAGCIERKMLPTSSNVIEHLQDHSSEWPPCTKNYLKRGGKVEYALRVVITFARDQDIYAGDGTAWKDFKGDFESLKSCRNDHEFGFIATMCGLSEPLRSSGER